jgi:hypothetical protein
MDDLVFIILRYVSDKNKDIYWKECYSSIRLFYPITKIVIIDDNSPYKCDNVFKLTNCEIIQSKYPRRAELLPYHYFHRLKLARKAIILHDSVFINGHIDVENLTTYKFIWDFESDSNTEQEIINIISSFNISPEFTSTTNDLINFYKNNRLWVGCFGVMSAITWDFLDKIDRKCNFLTILLNHIDNREKRMHFERIFACICIFYDQLYPAYFGNIHWWCYNITCGQVSWNIPYENYIGNKSYYKNFPIMKIWSGR